MNVKCYDNGGKTADRYTVIYFDYPERNGGFSAVAMSANPFHPQGFGQHCSAIPGDHLGRHIAFEELPEDCQRLVRQNLE